MTMRFAMPMFQDGTCAIGNDGYSLEIPESLTTLRLLVWMDKQLLIDNTTELLGWILEEIQNCEMEYDKELLLKLLGEELGSTKDN